MIQAYCSKWQRDFPVTGFFNFIIFLVLIGMIAGFSPPVQANYDYIQISDPFLRKIPIAVPVFIPMNNDPADRQTLVDATDQLSNAIEFTGYFDVLNRESYLVDANHAAIVVPEINFRNWTAIGAELMITGGYQADGKKLIMDLRLIDTFKQKLLVGKRYQGKPQDRRKMIHRFCSDVMLYLTGNRGIFGSKIAFLSTGTGNKEIFICDFDGKNVKQVTSTKNITLSPAWSSDGNWLAYTSYAGGKPDIYIKHLKGKGGYSIANKGINITPDWMPGQFSIAATLSFSGDPEIYLLTGTGKIIKRLTKSWGIDVSPSWSPDGKQMAFVSNRSGTPQIYLQNLNSGQVERLTYEGRYNTSPSWSPRGDRIAYMGVTNGHFNIFVITTDGRQLIQLTQQTGNNETPTWSPDGSLIAFSSTREESSRIYIMSAYGTDQRRLLSMPGEQTGPAWSPRIMDN